MCGVDIDGWEPDENEHQRQKVEDVLHERGLGACFLNMEVDGEVRTVYADLVNPRRKQIFQGYGDTKLEAFKNAVKQYYESINHQRTY